MEGRLSSRIGAVVLSVTALATACGGPVPNVESSPFALPIAAETAKPSPEPLKISSFSMKSQNERTEDMKRLLGKEVDMEIDKTDWQITESRERPISDKYRYIEVNSKAAGPKGFLVLVTKGELSELIITGFYGLKKNSTPETVFPVSIPPHKHLWFKDISFEGRPTFKFEKITPPES